MSRREEFAKLENLRMLQLINKKYNSEEVAKMDCKKEMLLQAEAALMYLQEKYNCNTKEIPLCIHSQHTNAGDMILYNLVLMILCANEI